MTFLRYDWLSLPRDEQKEGRSDLQKRVSEIIRRLALNEDQVRELPDNYEDAIRAHLFPTAYDPADPQRPFLPADLFDPKGTLVSLGEQQGRPVASDHLEFFDGRSIFLVSGQELSLSGGRRKLLHITGVGRPIIDLRRRFPNEGFSCSKTITLSPQLSKPYL